MSHSILVTGASGFVGSHFVKFFSKAGHAVVGLDIAPPPSKLKKYLKDFAVADMADEQKVIALLKTNQINGVVHCAAKCLVEESVREPALYRDYNVIRAGKLVDTIEKAGIRTFLFSSTAAVYGEPKSVPIPEDHPKAPVNPYGESKLEFEKQLLDRAKADRIDLGIFRYFNASGADPEGELGESHEPETHLIPNAIATTLGKRKSFMLYGNDYPTRDGTCERDFIHIWDLADAHLKLLDRLLREKRGGIYNLGTGKGHTVKEVLDEIDRQTGKKMKRDIQPRRPGDPAVLVADASRAKKELAWVPKYSELSKITSDAISFCIK